LRGKGREGQGKREAPFFSSKAKQSNRWEEQILKWRQNNFLKSFVIRRPGIASSIPIPIPTNFNPIHIHPIRIFQTSFKEPTQIQNQKPKPCLYYGLSSNMNTSPYFTKNLKNHNQKIQQKNPEFNSSSIIR
jgi:hypothetical protein